MAPSPSKFASGAQSDGDSGSPTTSNDGFMRKWRDFRADRGDDCSSDGEEGEEGGGEGEFEGEGGDGEDEEEEGGGDGGGEEEDGGDGGGEKEDGGDGGGEEEDGGDGGGEEEDGDGEDKAKRMHRMNDAERLLLGQLGLMNHCAILNGTKLEATVEKVDIHLLKQMLSNVFPTTNSLPHARFRVMATAPSLLPSCPRQSSTSSRRGCASF